MEADVRAYHHGDLRAALIDASFDLLAEAGLRGFSVAAVARRLGVSSAAPYRHFADRHQLLSAISATAARDLRAEIADAADAAGPDPADRLAAAAGTYVRYVARTGAGFHVIFAAELYEVVDDDRRAQTRAFMTQWLDLAAATGVTSHHEQLRLVEAAIAVAHGYVSLFADGFFDRGGAQVEDVAARAAEATRILVAPSDAGHPDRAG